MATPASNRTVFYGFGAYVGAIRGVTQGDWWPDDPQTLGFQPAALIPTDLAKNPTAVRAGVIPLADLQVDDHRSLGGLTSIGPRFPQGAMVGAVWLADTYYASLGATAPARLSSAEAAESRDYELTSLLYWSGPLAGRRFFGYHARVLTTNGTLAHVQIWTAGRSRIPNEPPAGTWWIDLATDAHPLDPSATQVNAMGQEGALFLDAATAQSLQLFGPKLPRALGFDALPEVA